MNGARVTPPRRVRAWLARVADRTTVLELDELFERRAAERGERAARRWYRGEALKLGALLRFDRMRAGDRSEGGRRASAGTALIDVLAAASRKVRRRPGHTAAVGATLGVGLAAIAAVYAVADWTLLRPVPGVRAPDEVVQIRSEITMAMGTFSLGVSHPDLLDLRHGARALEGIAGSHPVDVHVASAAAAERVTAELVTANYFEVLGVLVRGRGFVAEEERVGTRTVVLSDGLARRMLGTADFVTGSTITLNGRTYEVVGVAPSYRGPDLPGATEAWLPLGSYPDVIDYFPEGAPTKRTQSMWRILYGRVREGGSATDVPAQLASVASAVTSAEADEGRLNPLEHATMYEGLGAPVGMRDELSRTLRLMAGAALLLLVLATANAANLTLARAGARGHELAMQRALGAARRRLAAEAFIESLLLGLAAGLIGVVLAAASLAALRASGLDAAGADLSGVKFTPGTLLFLLCAAAGGGLITGILPALATLRPPAGHLLRSGLRTTSRSPLRSLLVAVQFAVSIALLIGAGLLARTILELREVQVGFTIEGLVAATVEPGLHGMDAERQVAYRTQLVQMLEDHRAISYAAVISSLPLDDSYSTMRMHTPEMPVRQALRPHVFEVSASLFRTLGMPFVEGAEPAMWNDEGSETPVVISESMARALFAGRSAVGNVLVSPNGSGVYRVAAVVGDARVHSLTEPPVPFMFIPLPIGFPESRWHVIARAAGDPASAIDAIHAVSRSLEPTLPVFDRTTLRRHIDGMTQTQQLAALLGSALAIAGILLSAIGLIATLGNMVRERRHEIAVRLALGAAPRSLVAGLVRDGLALATAGGLAGLACGFGLSGVIRSLLWGISRFDGATYALAFLAALALAAVAASIPARRAALVDPLAALNDG